MTENKATVTVTAPDGHQLFQDSTDCFLLAYENGDHPSALQFANRVTSERLVSVLLTSLNCVLDCAKRNLSEREQKRFFERSKHSELFFDIAVVDLSAAVFGKGKGAAESPDSDTP